MTATLRHRPGELIKERYLIERELGAGAFGTVYLCRDCELDTHVAVKELHVLDVGGSNLREQALARFRREAVNLSELRHPHIVSGHYERNAGTWLACPICGQVFRGLPRCPQDNALPVVVHQRHYLVMEYVDGPDLGEAAEAAGGALPINAALRYIRQTAEALGLVHARGLVHRDIKPENIHLRRAGDDAVLLDFGIATASGEAGDFSTRAQRHTTGGGTYGYAPDSPTERRYPDARSDIHALGMTLYRLVSGRDPTDPADLHAMRRMRPRDFNAALSPALEAFIVRSISSEPAERPDDAELFLVGLLQATAPPPLPRAPAAPDRPSAAAPGLAGASPAGYGGVPQFVFRSGERAADIASLVALIDRHRQEAKEYLYHGDFAAWLSQAGRADLAQRAREIVLEYPDRKYQGIEALVQSTGLAEPPSLDVYPPTLDLGRVPPSARRTVTLKLANHGRGHLFGLLRCTVPGVYFDEAFEGNRHNIAVTFDTRSFGAGHNEGEIVIDSSAGEERVPFSLEVQGAASPAPMLTVIFWATMGMVYGLLLRLLPMAATAGRHGGDWLTPQALAETGPNAWLFGLLLWAIFLLLAVGEATRRRSWGFFFSAIMAALPLSLVCALVSGDLLLAGDAALQPALGALCGSWAPGGWMAAGGFAGAAYGTLRRIDDVFSRRLLQVLLGWLCFAVTLGALLGIARLGGIS